jgi:hypothetical protein
MSATVEALRIPIDLHPRHGPAPGTQRPVRPPDKPVSTTGLRVCLGRWFGRTSITSYIALAPNRFEDFWRD